MTEHTEIELGQQEDGAWARSSILERMGIKNPDKPNGLDHVEGSLSNHTNGNGSHGNWLDAQARRDYLFDLCGELLEAMSSNPDYSFSYTREKREYVFTVNAKGETIEFALPKETTSATKRERAVKQETLSQIIGLYESSLPEDKRASDKLLLRAKDALDTLYNPQACR